MSRIRIAGMRCGNCTNAVSKALAAIDGLSEVVVDLEKGEARYVETKPVAQETIKSAIEKLGFDVL